MIYPGQHILPQDHNVKDKAQIRNVSEFIGRVNDYIHARQQTDCFFVYRGEPDIYPSPCRPNIFRKNVMNGNKFFEKSLFDAMRQNRLTGEKCYLDNAIDAQHGEFPSRLLDVSYNCLTALYFAVTPYYHKEESSMDDRDGMVYLFFIDEIFSPSATNTKDNYNAIINRDQPWYQGKMLFEKNHKFIDHTKLNDRIIAQQGAFILFQGDEAETLPIYMSYGILIPGSAKAAIRAELKQLFGIHTGSIYPEIINLVKELSGKSKRLNTDEFNCKNELRYALRQLDKELDYYLDYAVAHKSARNIEEILIHIEHIVNSYRNGLLEFVSDIESNQIPGITKEDFKKIVCRYNQIIEQFSTALEQYDIGEFSKSALLIQFS